VSGDGARPLRAREVAFVAALAIGLGTAPTVGDVGGCGSQAKSLDRTTFGRARKQIDCQRCNECGLSTHACGTACDPQAPSTVVWPPSCDPLLHDGDVCLRALAAASCATYGSFVDDVAPANPTECDFCHEELDSGAAGVGEL